MAHSLIDYKDFSPSLLNKKNAKIKVNVHKRKENSPSCKPNNISNKKALVENIKEAQRVIKKKLQMNKKLIIRKPIIKLKSDRNSLNISNLIRVVKKLTHKTSIKYLNKNCENTKYKLTNTQAFTKTNSSINSLKQSISEDSVVEDKNNVEIGSSGRITGDWYEDDSKGHGRISFPKEYSILSNETKKDYYEDVEPCTLLYTVKDNAEERIKLLQQETKQMTEDFRREIAEKNEYILSQVLREQKIHNEYKDLLNIQTKLIIQEVSNIIHNTQTEQINDLIEKLTQCISRLSESIAMSSGRISISPIESVRKSEISNSKLEKIERTINKTKRIQEEQVKLRRKYQEEIALLENATRTSESTQEESNKKKHEITLSFKNEENVLDIARKRTLAKILNTIATLMNGESSLEESNKSTFDTLKEVMEISPNTSNLEKVSDKREEVIKMEKEEEEKKKEARVNKAVLDFYSLEYKDTKAFGGYCKNKLNATLASDKKKTEVNKSMDGLYDKMLKQVKIKQHKEEMPRGIYTALWVIDSYIDDLFTEVLKDPESLISCLSLPIHYNPLFVLGQLQHEDKDYFEGIEGIYTEPVLAVNFYSYLERQRKVDTIDEALKNSEQEQLQIEWSNIHNKCIFDAVNEALDCYRSYGLRGLPLPWSANLRQLTYRNGSTSIVQELIGKVKLRVMTWAMTNAGTLQLPKEFIGDERLSETDKLLQFRLEKLEAMIITEVRF